MSSNITSLARQSSSLKATTGRLERAVFSIEKAEENIQNRQKSFHNSLIATEKDDQTYAWILPKGGRLISSDTPLGSMTKSIRSPVRSPIANQYSDLKSPTCSAEDLADKLIFSQSSATRKKLQFGPEHTTALAINRTSSVEDIVKEIVQGRPVQKKIVSPFQQIPNTAFDYPANERYETEDFINFAAKCKSAMAIKGKLSFMQNKDIAFWYYLKLPIQSMFGTNGLYANNGLPSAPGITPKPASNRAKVRPKDNGDKKIDGELSPHELHTVNYKTYIDIEIEREIVELVKLRKCKPKKKGGPEATDKQKIFFGCTRMAQKLLAQNKMPFAKDELQLKASIARALYMVNNAPSSAFHVKMWECRRVPWVFAILECIMTNFPSQGSNPREHDELPAAVLVNLRGNTLVRKSRKRGNEDMSDSDTDFMFSEEQLE